MLCDWLLAIGETVAEVQQEAQERANRGVGSTTLRNGMRQVEINYAEGG